jgi:hypothetical protein
MLHHNPDQAIFDSVKYTFVKSLQIGMVVCLPKLRQVRQQALTFTSEAPLPYLFLFNFFVFFSFPAPLCSNLFGDALCVGELAGAIGDRSSLDMALTAPFSQLISRIEYFIFAITTILVRSQRQGGFACEMVTIWIGWTGKDGEAGTRHICGIPGW